MMALLAPPDRPISSETEYFPRSKAEYNTMSNSNEFHFDASDEIDQAIVKLGLARDVIYRCDEVESANIYNTARSTFVNDNPRVWWLSLKNKKRVGIYGNTQEWMQLLGQALANHGGRCWIIPEQIGVAVYDASISIVIDLLLECSGFECNFVGSNYEWLVCDTDHSEVLLAKP